LNASKAGRSGSESTNIVAIGKPGVGKSHALCAVAYELAQQGHPVLWTATSTLVQRLLAAKRDLRLPQELAKLDRFACVFLDDIGYVQQDREEMEVLFTFLAQRYERRSVGITTNLVFSDWQRIDLRSVEHHGRSGPRDPPLRHSRHDGVGELPSQNGTASAARRRR
jgi:DNA replication protein DnaC